MTYLITGHEAKLPWPDEKIFNPALRVDEIKQQFLTEKAGTVSDFLHPAYAEKLYDYVAGVFEAGSG